MFDIVYNGMLSTKAVASAVANIVRRQQKRFYSIRSRKSGVKFELCRQGSLKPFTPSCESFSIAFSEFKLVCGSWTYSPYSTT
ncbi:hypothetical protein PC118_g21275 [Phytophthora cactorum]|uniref:Uncharacterized protein n=1 Tax=Phytophthora cactorum TaxID=29920 RepID=A0A8T1EWQ2_9STRA|nr:hypothetical protein PC118_g21275 [Phytophthora cactorum]